MIGRHRILRGSRMVVAFRTDGEIAGVPDDGRPLIYLEAPCHQSRMSAERRSSSPNSEQTRIGSRRRSTRTRWSRLFLDEDSREAADRMAASFPPVKAMVKIRTKYLDDVLDSQLRDGFRQVVVLGAGLDTRAVRKASHGVTYFEIDDPATLALKRRCYERAALNINVTFIPGNYVTDGLVEMLARNGFDFDLPTYFIWEGNTMYLPLAASSTRSRKSAVP